MVRPDPDRPLAVSACPNCGFNRLRTSRFQHWGERVRGWWTGTSPFRCRACGWRDLLPDVWLVDDVRAARGDGDETILDAVPEPAGEPVALGARRAAPGAARQRVKLWVDDRRPAPEGWIQAASVDEARQVLTWEEVEEASLDYDLGLCPDCAARVDAGADTSPHGCVHVPTGYQLCLWMAETGHWPQVPPSVHSGNLEGAALMRGVILQHWRPPEQAATPRAPAGGAAPVAPARSVVAATISTCPNCGQASLERRHRRSVWQQVRSWLRQSVPAECLACGWHGWIRGAILVRLAPGTPAGSTDVIDQLDD